MARWNNPLYSSDEKIKYTKTEYNNSTSKSEFYQYCPDDASILCTFKSINPGLCSNEETSCNDHTNKKLPIIDKEFVKASENKNTYGYAETHLANYCGKHKIIASYFSDTYDILPQHIKIMTYNIWGMLYQFGNDEGNNFFIKTMEIRMNKIAEIILEKQPDIICIQEISSLALKFLNKRLKDIYPYQFEEYLNTEKTRKSRNRGLEIYFFSKFLPKSYTHYSISGNLGYENACALLEFDNLLIANCYLQAGSKHSPNQEPYWFHYTRCRSEELRAIKTILEKYNMNKIVLGDFNFNIGGTMEEQVFDWPENLVIDQMNLSDSWNNQTNGFTENTTINKMRWNVKFMEKHFRYDAILYNGQLRALGTEMVGIDEIPLSKEDSELFIKYRIPNVPDKLDKIKYFDDKSKLMSLFPSDHFGLVGKFEFV